MMAVKGLSHVKRVLVSRRDFLTTAAGLALAALMPGCSRPPRRELERRTLVRMARLIYPHDALDDDVYMDVLQPVLARAKSKKGFAGFLRRGVQMLDAGERGSWLSASRDDQLRALERIKDEWFFKVIQGNVRRGLYERPAVWKLIGYEGSSVEFGGYLHRGFDDIEWLPEG